MGAARGTSMGGLDLGCGARGGGARPEKTGRMQVGKKGDWGGSPTIKARTNVVNPFGGGRRGGKLEAIRNDWGRKKNGRWPQSAGREKQKETCDKEKLIEDVVACQCVGVAMDRENRQVLASKITGDYAASGGGGYPAQRGLKRPRHARRLKNLGGGKKKNPAGR